MKIMARTLALFSGVFFFLGLLSLGFRLYLGRGGFIEDMLAPPRGQWQWFCGAGLALFVLWAFVVLLSRYSGACKDLKARGYDVNSLSGE